MEVYASTLSQTDRTAPKHDWTTKRWHMVHSQEPDNPSKAPGYSRPVAHGLQSLASGDLKIKSSAQATEEAQSYPESNEVPALLFQEKPSPPGLPEHRQRCRQQLRSSEKAASSNLRKLKRDYRSIKNFREVNLAGLREEQTP